MKHSSLILIPPLLVFGYAIISHNVIASLLIGIIASSFIGAQYGIMQSGTLMFDAFYKQITDFDNIYVLVFLLAIGIIIQIMQSSGGISTYRKKLSAIITSKRGAELLSLGLSTSLFLDDYLNSLTVGAIMQPITDKLRIPRAKLAFLLDCMSAPLCVLIPATTWIAMIFSQLQIAGITDDQTMYPVIQSDPFSAYLHIIPYLLYPICIVITAYMVSVFDISFGAMKTYEEIAQNTGNVFGGKKTKAETQHVDSEHESLLGFIMPITLFIGLTIILLLYSGNSSLFGGTNSALKALQSGDSSLWALCIASCSTLAISLIALIQRNAISSSNIYTMFINGFDLMKNSFMVLLLAWTFSDLLLNTLHAGTYMGSMLSAALPIALIPVIVFLISTVLSATTGSAWATIAIMIPLTVQVVTSLFSTEMPLSLNESYLFAPTLGAVLAGAIAGGHFSPITDSTVMASTSAGSYHLDHVKTQIIYSLPAFIGSIAGFFVAGMLYTSPHKAALSILTGILVTGIGLISEQYIYNWFFKKSVD
jgi:Na+/H+ antiporter NhaC